MSTTADPLAAAGLSVLAALTPSERCQFILTNFSDDPHLEDLLVAQGADREHARELAALAQSWAAAKARGFTSEERQHAEQIIAGPPIIVDARAGLSTETRDYLRTLHPSQPIDFAHIRAMAAARAKVVRIHRTPRQSHRAHYTAHAARAICGGSDGDGDGGSSDGDGSAAPATPRLTPPAALSPAASDAGSLPDWDKILRSVRQHIAYKYKEDWRQARDLASAAVLRVLERQATGELFTYPMAAAKAEADVLLYRGWREQAAAKREAHEASAIFKPSRGRRVQSVVPKNDDQLGRRTKVCLPHDGQGRGSGRFKDDACVECSLWTWRNGKEVRRKGYERPAFPRWVWQDGARVIQWSCPACRPRRAPALIRYPSETLLLIGERAQQLYATLWRSCRVAYGLRWTLAPGEAFSNGLGVLPADHPSPWNPPPSDLYPTASRIYARTKGRRHSMIADRTPHGVSLDRWKRPAFTVTNADLAREAHALRQARRRRPTTPIVTEGFVAAGAPLVCATCRESRPFALSCVHTFQRHPSASEVKQAHQTPSTVGVSA